MAVTTQRQSIPSGNVTVRGYVAQQYVSRRRSRFGAPPEQHSAPTPSARPPPAQTPPPRDSSLRPLTIPIATLGGRLTVPRPSPQQPGRRHSDSGCFSRLTTNHIRPAPEHSVRELTALFERGPSVQLDSSSRLTPPPPSAIESMHAAQHPLRRRRTPPSVTPSTAPASSAARSDVRVRGISQQIGHAARPAPRPQPLSASRRYLTQGSVEDRTLAQNPSNWQGLTTTQLPPIPVSTPSNPTLGSRASRNERNMNSVPRPHLPAINESHGPRISSREQGREARRQVLESRFLRSLPTPGRRRPNAAPEGGLARQPRDGAARAPAAAASSQQTYSTFELLDDDDADVHQTLGQEYEQFRDAVLRQYWGLEGRNRSPDDQTGDSIDDMLHVQERVDMQAVRTAQIWRVVSNVMQQQDQANLEHAMRMSMAESYSGGFCVPPIDEEEINECTTLNTFEAGIHEADRCTICLSEFCPGDELRELGCRHFFHASCVDRWLAHSGQCPLCKVAAQHS